MDWQTGGTITGVIAVVYGLLVSMGLRSASEKTRQRVVMVGALVVLAAAILLFLLPLMKVY